MPPDVEIDRCQDHASKRWWRIMREQSTGCQWLETISPEALRDGLPWTYNADLGSQCDAKEAMEAALMFESRRATR